MGSTFTRAFLQRASAVGLCIGVVALITAGEGRRISPFELGIGAVAGVAFVLADLARMRVARIIIPELRDRVPGDEVVRLVDDQLALRTHPLSAVSALIISVLVMVMLLRILAAIVPLHSTGFGRVLASVWLLFPCLGWPIVWALIVRRRVATEVRRCVNRSKSLQLCEHCGYDLQGTLEPRCPECGCATRHGHGKLDI